MLSFYVLNFMLIHSSYIYYRHMIYYFYIFKIVHLSLESLLKLTMKLKKM